MQQKLHLQGLQFYIPFNCILQSCQDDGKVIMNGYMQYNPVFGTVATRFEPV